MATTVLTILVASEGPEARHLLTRVVGREPGAVVVGEAENGVKAMSLARRLRPNVALVDCQLPHLVGLDSARLSRTGGLDTAIGILRELPSSCVVLLNDLGSALRHDAHLTGSGELALYTKTGTTRLSLGELRNDSPRPRSLAFARVQVRAEPAQDRLGEIARVSERAALYGGLGILAGLGLMLTLLFTAPGAVLALLGVAVLLLSLAVWMVAVWRSRRRAALRVSRTLAPKKQEERSEDDAEAGP